MTGTRATLPALARAARRCTLCAAELPAGPRPILQVHPEARVLIASQAPGRLAHESGVPFDDPSGRRLRDWMGIGSEEFYDPRRIAILPMGFCYPGTGGGGDLPPIPRCAATWRDRFLKRFRRLQLTLVIGRYAQRWHCPDAAPSVTSTVANWRDLDEGIMPLPHPSPRNNAWLARNPWFDEELVPALRLRVRAALDGKHIREAQQ